MRKITFIKQNVFAGGVKGKSSPDVVQTLLHEMRLTQLRRSEL